MKIRLILVITSVLLLGFGPNPARAGGGLAGSGDPFTAFFDENGNGSYDPRDGTGMKQLLTVAGAANLIYILPSPVITGDVRIFEPTTGALASGECPAVGAKLCPNDDPISASKVDECNQQKADPKCGQAYTSLLECEAANLSCNADGKKDTAKLLSICEAEFVADGDCVEHELSGPEAGS